MFAIIYLFFWWHYFYFEIFCPKNSMKIKYVKNVTYLSGIEIEYETENNIK